MKYQPKISQREVKMFGSMTQKSSGTSFNRSSIGLNQPNKVEMAINLIKTLDFSLITKNENFLYQFLEAFNDQSDIFDLFNKYIDWIEENDFQPFLDLIVLLKPVIAIKTALICERMSLLVIFYLYTKGLYKTEIIFIKKTMMHVYKNHQELHKTLFAILKDIDETKQLPKMPVRNLSTFGSEIMQMTVEKNNDKILKILEVEIQSEEKEIFDSFHKLKKLMDDFSLNESWSYFKTTFVTIVA